MQTFDLEGQKESLISRGHHFILVMAKCQVTWDRATSLSLNKGSAQLAKRNAIHGLGVWFSGSALERDTDTETERQTEVGEKENLTGLTVFTVSSFSKKSVTELWFILGSLFDF